MKMSSGVLTVFGVGLVVSFAAGCSGGSGAAVDDSPEGRAVEFRQGLMETIAWKVGQLRGMTAGEITVDDAAFTKGASDVAALAGMVPEGFIPGSDLPGSAALPEIWSNADDFAQKAEALRSAATTLAAATAGGGFEAGKDLVQGVGQACGGCHRAYRRRDE